MAILVDENTKVICQGFTGLQGELGKQIIRDSGLNVIAADDLAETAQQTVKVVIG